MLDLAPALVERPLSLSHARLGVILQLLLVDLVLLPARGLLVLDVGQLGLVDGSLPDLHNPQFLPMGGVPIHTLVYIKPALNYLLETRLADHLQLVLELLGHAPEDGLVQGQVQLQQPAQQGDELQPEVLTVLDALVVAQRLLLLLEEGRGGEGQDHLEVLALLDPDYHGLLLPLRQRSIALFLLDPTI